MLVEDFDIPFAYLVQKLFKFKIEFIQYFDCNDIQKPEGEDPICLWAPRTSHQLLAGLTCRNKQPFTLTFSPRVSGRKQIGEENMQTPHREASGP